MCACKYLGVCVFLTIYIVGWESIAVNEFVLQGEGEIWVREQKGPYEEICYCCRFSLLGLNYFVRVVTNTCSKKGKGTNKSVFLELKFHFSACVRL